MSLGCDRRLREFLLKLFGDLFQLFFLKGSFRLRHRGRGGGRGMAGSTETGRLFELLEFLGGFGSV